MVQLGERHAAHLLASTNARGLPTPSFNNVYRIESPPTDRYPQIGSERPPSALSRHPPMHLHPVLHQRLKDPQPRQRLQSLAQPHTVRSTLEDV